MTPYEQGYIAGLVKLAVSPNMAMRALENAAKRIGKNYSGIPLGNEAGQLALELKMLPKAQRTLSRAFKGMSGPRQANSFMQNLEQHAASGKPLNKYFYEASPERLMAESIRG